MACPECEKNKKKTAKGFTKAVVEIKNPDKLVLFRKVVVPASMGTEEQFPASVGKFSNVLLQYEANGDTYLYSSDGIPTQLSSDVSELQRQLDELKIVVTNEIADRIAADGTINSRIDQEILDRQAADNDLSDALAAEVAARKAADNTLDGKITTEKNARIAADNTLQTNINNEATARAAADSTLDGKITTEKEAREAADRTLQTNINNEATTRANADTALGTRITNETTARQNADNALDGRITTEANTRSAADSALAEDISAEVTRAKAAETALGGRIDDEATARAAADTTLDGNITAEATARANADTVLDGKITDEATARANADTALGTRITNETTARTNADTALGTRIDNEATARANADTAIEGKLNRNVLYDLEMETDANNVTFVEDKINLKTGATTTERDVIPAASSTTAGTISASEYISLVDAEEKITALLEGAVAIDNLPANPTQAQLTAAWKTATGKDELINRASIYDSANQLVHTYYTNVSEWEDSPAGGQITIDQFTNSAAGIIKGSTTDGNVSANLDGTGTVSGWTALKNTVAGKQDTLTAGSNISISGSTISATDTTYSAGTGLSLTGTTFAVDTTTIAQKSDIPTVNNATLTIQKNGSTVKTFTANASTNVTANITVPTKTSDLTNDSNFPVDANYVHTDNNFTTALKNKLDGIAAGAEVNQNAFSNVKVGGTTVAADSKTDTLELVAGSNVTLTPDATNDKVTIAATDTNTTYTFANGTNGFTVTPSGGSAQTVTVTPSIANATTSTAGLMSAADKTAFENLKPVVRKLYSDGTDIPANANLNTATYLTVGRYKCPQSATAATLTNCPTNQGFMMDVYNTLGTSRDDQSSASWTSRTRKILNYHGDEWVQVFVKSGNSVEYGSWEKIAHDVDLPTVNNATLTIQKNGTNVQTFTANSSTNKTANITVPTKVTDLTDGANYVAKDGDFYVTGEGSNFSMTGTSQNVYADLKVKGDTSQQTYSGKNLVNWAAYGNNGGATITVDGDGYFSVKATSTTSNYINISTRSSISLPAGTYTFSLSSATTEEIRLAGTYEGEGRGAIASIAAGGTSTTFTTTKTMVEADVWLPTSTGSAVDIKIRPMLEKGSTPTSFEPYVGGVPAPNPDYPQEVEVVTGRQVITSMGKNLYKTPASTTNNGVKYTLNPDGTYNIHGTATAQANDITYMSVKGFTDGATYAFSATKTLKSGQRILLEAYNGSTWVRHAFHPTGQDYLDSGHQTIVGAINISGADRLRVVLRTDNGVTVDIDNVGFQLEKANAVTSFEPYQGKEYEVNLGKNLFDKSTVTNGYRLGSDGLPYADTPFSVSDYIPIQGNTTYTYSRKLTTGDQTVTAICYYNASKTFISRTMPMITNHTASGQVTSPANAVYARIADRTEGLNAYQFEKGSTATSYAPYFTPIELCKLGNYQDYLYPSGGKWYLHKAIGHGVRDVTINGIADDNTATPTTVSPSGTFDLGNWDWTPDYATTAGNAILSSNIGVYKLDANVTGNSGARAMESGTFCQRQGTNDRIYFRNTGYAGKTGDEVKATLLSNSGGTNLWWYLSTPTDTEITNPLLVAQLDDLWRNLQSGTNKTMVNVATSDMGTVAGIPAILGVTAFTNTLASAMAGINERMNRLPAIPQITMTTTDPGEGQTLADNHYIAVFE